MTTSTDAVLAAIVSKRPDGLPPLEAVNIARQGFMLCWDIPGHGMLMTSKQFWDADTKAYIPEAAIGFLVEQAYAEALQAIAEKEAAA